MKPTRIYVDTSVLGGCFEPEFAPWSKGLIADFRARTYLPVFSTVVEAEIRRAPTSVQQLYGELAGFAGFVIPMTVEAQGLQEAYLARGILPAKFSADMLHIALATVENIDLLVSWNFKHIVRFDKIRAFGAVNLEQGYRPLSIYSPREVTTYGRGANPNA